MMKKIYYLKTCSTCQKIIKELGGLADFEHQNIKEAPITVAQIEQMQALTGSYESLFSRRAMKYQSMGLKDKTLTEADYKNLILEEYTFLKRPVIIVNGEIFVGNTQAIVAAAKAAIKPSK